MRKLEALKVGVSTAGDALTYEYLLSFTTILLTKTYIHFIG